MLSLTLRQIEYACGVAAHGGMSAAAGALHVSQPALSVALAQLEAHLGQPLFLRRPGGRLMPTSFGQRWLAEAEDVLQRLTRLADPARLSGQTLRLAVFEDLAASCLGPLLARTADQIDLRPSLMGFEDLAQALTHGRADLALTWDLGLESGIDREIIAQIPPHAVLAETHPLARHATLSLQDVADQPLILTDQGLSLGHMRGLFAQAGLQPQIAHRAATNALMLSLAANGLGVGLSYSRPLQRRSHDGALFALKPVTDGGAEAIVLAQSAANPLTAPAARLATLLPELLFSEAEEPQPAEG